MMVQSLYESGKFYMFLPLELSLRPSRVYLAVLALTHGLALLGVWLAALPVWIQALMTLVLFIAGMRLRRKDSNGPHGLRVSQSGQIELLDGGWLPVSLRGRPVVLPWFVSLIVAVEGGAMRKLVLLPDSAEADGLRKLRVWLKWAAGNMSTTFPASALRTPPDTPGRGVG